MSTETLAERDVSLLHDVPVQLSVELGSCTMTMKSVLQLAQGSVVQLDKTADTPADVYVNDRLIAHGEVVVVDNRFGIKITELI